MDKYDFMSQNIITEITTTQTIDWKTDAYEIIDALREVYPDCMVLYNKEIAELAATYENASPGISIGVIGQFVSQYKFALYSIDTMEDCYCFVLRGCDSIPPVKIQLLWKQQSVEFEGSGSLKGEKVDAVLCIQEGSVWGQQLIENSKRQSECKIWEACMHLPECDNLVQFDDTLAGYRVYGESVPRLVDLKSWNSDTLIVPEPGTAIRKSIHLETLQRNADGIWLGAFGSQLCVAKNLQLPPEEWLLLSGAYEYTGKNAGWLGNQVLILTKNGKRDLLQRFDSQGQFLCSMVLEHPDKKEYKKAPSKIFGAPWLATGDPQFAVVYAGGGFWRIDNQKAVPLGLPKGFTGLEYNVGNPVWVEGHGFFFNAHTYDTDYRTWMYQLDTASWALKRCEVSSILPRGNCTMIPIIPRAIDAAMLVLEINGDGFYNITHCAYLWSQGEGICTGISMKSFNGQYPSFFYVKGISRLVAHSKDRVYQCLPIEELMALLQAQPNTAMHWVNWESNFEIPKTDGADVLWKHINK